MQRLFKPLVFLLPALLLVSVGVFLAFSPFLGQEEPLWWQYLTWIAGFATGELGESAHYGAPVAQLLLVRFPVTLALAAAAAVLAAAAALPLGLAAACGGWPDRVMTVLWRGMQAVPALLCALALAGVFGGKRPVFLEPEVWRMVLVVLAAALPQSARLAGGLRNKLKAELETGYARVAYSKGNHTAAVLWRHARRNISLAPLLGQMVRGVAVGVVVAEWVLDVDGAGQLLIGALVYQDMPTARSVTAVLGALAVLWALLSQLWTAIPAPEKQKRKQPRWNWRLIVGLILAGLFLIFLGTGCAVSMLLHESVHPLGCDATGRDVLKLTLLGAGNTALLALGAVAVSFLLAFPLGAFAGYSGGKLDRMVLALAGGAARWPLELLALVLMGVLGPSTVGLSAVTAALILPGLTGGVQEIFAQYQGKEFVRMARLAKIPKPRILLAHILPNVWPELLGRVAGGVCWGITLETALSFFGLGSQVTTLGGVLAALSGEGISPSAVGPALVLLLLLLAVGLLGEGAKKWMEEGVCF